MKWPCGQPKILFLKYPCISASLNPTITPPKVTMTTSNQKSVNIGITPVQIPMIPKLRLNWSIWSQALLNPGAKIEPKRSPIALPVNIQLTFSGSVATFCDKTGSVGPVIDCIRIALAHINLTELPIDYMIKCCNPTQPWKSPIPILLSEIAAKKPNVHSLLGGEFCQFSAMFSPMVKSLLFYAIIKIFILN